MDANATHTHKEMKKQNHRPKTEIMKIREPVLSSRDKWTLFPSLYMTRLSSPKSWVYPSSKDIIGNEVL
jgi:hypothetical protein